MENNKNNLKGKVINPISETIKVEKLDWSKINDDLNKYLHGRFPNRKEDSWYWENHYSGLIEKNGVYILISKEATFMTPQVFHVRKKDIGFEVGVFQDLSKEDKISTQPEWEFKLVIEEIEKIRTGVIVSLPEFMDTRYRYNSRIYSNEAGLLQYLKEETDYFVEKKINESDKFIVLHDKFKNLFELKDFNSVKELIQSFNNDNSTIGELKSILVITKSFKEHELISGIRKEIVALLEQKTGKKLK